MYTLQLSRLATRANPVAIGFRSNPPHYAVYICCIMYLFVNKYCLNQSKTVPSW